MQAACAAASDADSVRRPLRWYRARLGRRAVGLRTAAGPAGVGADWSRPVLGVSCWLSGRR